MRYFIYLSTLWLLVSCATAPEQNQAIITDINDFENYLETDRSKLITDLQQRATQLQQDVTADSMRIVQMSRLAAVHNQLYDLTGAINHLESAVSLRENVLTKTFIKPEAARRSLAQLYIKQHRFKEAHDLMHEVPAKEKEDQLIKFDIAMELGHHEIAQQLLQEFRNMNDYNYLIRAAKWNDYDGKLDDTIRLMVKAMQLAEQSGSESLMLWSYSNIADYYGHHGDLNLSYIYYLKTLELDPHNDYALKGISWIAFSNDGQPELAAQILNTLKSRHHIPDYQLALADIFEYQEQEEKSNQLRQQFLIETENSAYGGMYNTYRIETLLSGNKKQQEQALNLAKIEINNRATPETYDLLGFAYLINDMPDQAMNIHKTQVLDKTYEPVAQLHLAQVLKENDQLEAAQKIKKELLEARYELGPVVIKVVERI